MLELPQEYTTALESVLGCALGAEALKTGSVRKELLRFAPAIARISERLTLERGMIAQGRYLLDDELRKAYMLYFMSTNLLKLWAPLRELALLDLLQPDQEGTLRALDLGSGPGTAIWSLILFLRGQHPELSQGELMRTSHLRFTLTDKHDVNLRDAERFFRRLHRATADIPTTSGEFEPLDLRLSEIRSFAAEYSGQFDLITMMNALNELPEADDAELIRVLLSLLSDQGSLILVEPGTREIARRALRLRQLAIESGGAIVGPCTHSGTCHALDKETDWCHSEIKWRRPTFIECLDDETGLLRLSLKSTYFTIRRQPINISKLVWPTLPIAARVVSELFNEKGRVRAILCHDSGRGEFVMNLRDRTELNRRFANAERYDLVGLDQVEARAHDTKVSKDSTFNRVLDASGARIVDN